eukprot:403333750
MQKVVQGRSNKLPSHLLCFTKINNYSQIQTIQAERYAIRKSIQHGNNLLVPLNHSGSAFKNQVQMNQQYQKKPTYILKQQILEKNLDLYQRDEKDRVHQQEQLNNILGMYSRDNNDRILKKREKMAQLIRKLKEEQHDKKEQIDLLDSKMRLYYLIREYAKETQGAITPDGIDNFTEEILDLGFFDLLKEQQKQSDQNIRDKYLRRKLMVKHKPGEGDLAEADSDTSSMMIQDQEFEDKFPNGIGSQLNSQGQGMTKGQGGVVNSIPVIRDLYNKSKHQLDNQSPQKAFLKNSKIPILQGSKLLQSGQKSTNGPQKCKFCIDKEKGVKMPKGKCLCEKKQREWNKSQLNDAMRKKVMGLEDIKRMNTKTLEYLDIENRSKSLKNKSQSSNQKQTQSLLTTQNNSPSNKQKQQNSSNKQLSKFTQSSQNKPPLIKQIKIQEGTQIKHPLESDFSNTQSTAFTKNVKFIQNSNLRIVSKSNSKGQRNIEDVQKGIEITTQTNESLMIQNNQVKHKNTSKKPIIRQRMSSHDFQIVEEDSSPEKKKLLINKNDSQPSKNIQSLTVQQVGSYSKHGRNQSSQIQKPTFSSANIQMQAAQKDQLTHNRIQSQLPPLQTNKGLQLRIKKDFLESNIESSTQRQYQSTTDQNSKNHKNSIKNQEFKHDTDRGSVYSSAMNISQNSSNMIDHEAQQKEHHRKLLSKQFSEDIIEKEGEILKSQRESILINTNRSRQSLKDNIKSVRKQEIEDNLKNNGEQLNLDVMTSSRRKKSQKNNQNSEGSFGEKKKQAKTFNDQQMPLNSEIDEVTSSDKSMSVSQESQNTSRKLEDYQNRGYLDLNEEMRNYNKEIKVSVLDSEYKQNEEEIQRIENDPNQQNFFRYSGFSHDGTSRFKKQMMYWHRNVKPSKIPKPSQRKNLELQILDVQNQGTKVLRLKKFKLSDLIIE